MAQQYGNVHKQGVDQRGSAAEVLLDLAPGEFRRGAGLRARLPRMAARGRALQHPLHDALADAGDTEEVVRHAELPHARLDRRTPRAGTVGIDIVRLTRNSQGPELE